MHRAQDSRVPPNSSGGFRLVTRSILCTGHRIHKFRAGFPSYAQGTGFTRVVTPRRHYAQGTGSCKPSPTTRVNLMHRAQDSRVPLGHSLDPMHRAQDSQVPCRFSILCTGHRIHDSRHSLSSLCTGHHFTITVNIFCIYYMHAVPVYFFANITRVIFLYHSQGTGFIEGVPHGPSIYSQGTFS